MCGDERVQETQRNIYKAFYTKKGAQGTGLGLWISAEIVQRHKGRLHVRSCETTKLHGTVFQLFLPFQAASGDLATESVSVHEEAQNLEATRKRSTA